jgi:hypothetical protein
MPTFINIFLIGLLSTTFFELLISTYEGFTITTAWHVNVFGHQLEAPMNVLPRVRPHNVGKCRKL